MKKILIIEDDPIVARIYQNRLEKEGCEVEIAADGQSGFYRIHEFHPEAVLLDLMLPKLNGIDILKKIRAQTQFQRVPIIVFTNAYVPNMIQEAFQAGATQVFNKATLTPRQVIDALQTAMFLTTGEVPPPPQKDPPSKSGPGRESAAPPGHPAAPDPSATAFTVKGAPISPSHSGAATSPAAPPPVSIPEDSSKNSDEAYQAEVEETFHETAPETLAAIRRSLQEFSKALDESSRIPHLLELYRKVHSLTGSAGIAGLHCIAQMASALEVLLRELHEKPKNINVSTMRTVAHAIDFTTELFTRGADDKTVLATPINILVVDDEILSRRAITYALEKAGLKSASVEDPQVALKMASDTAYDLIFLDVQMPGMDGFDLCTKIRALATNKNTPVIFVTSLTDFKSRARSSLSGGTDLIAKPFMFMELSVKALTYVLRGRLAKKSESNPAAERAVA
jgi:DNA-binding response OmpR family regulator/HPt (histidine-containing phosphotransfer) domain-containing protein